MRGRPFGTILTVCCLVVVVGGVAVVLVASGAAIDTAGADNSPVGGEDGEYGVAPQGEEVDQVALEVTLHADGSATWHMEHRIRLDSEAATQGFEETRSRVETDGAAFRENFTERVRGMATTAERDTGRVMVVENVSVSAQREQLPQEYGIIVYEFRWYGFAETEDGLRAGDALDGLFLDEKTTLLVSWPGNATLVDVSPEPDDRRDSAVVWDGPLEFASGEPAVVLESESLSFGPDLGWNVSSNDILLTLGVALFVFIGLIGTGGLALRHRRRADDTAADEPDEDGDETVGEESTAGEEVTGSESEDTGSSAAGSEVPDELLSNEERVLALLEAEGGRIKQQDVVQRLDWSETKTSEVVSELRETDQIEVYRIGRNNVLALPGTGLGLDSENEEESDENGGEEG